MKNQYRIIAICYVGWMFDFYDLALFSYVLPSVSKSFFITHQQEAWLLGIGLGASGVGGILFGWLADRHGRKTVMVWTIVLYSLGTLLCAAAQNTTMLIILRALAGLGLGGEWAVGHALVAESVDHKARGRAGALLQSGEPVGVALAAVVGILLLPQVGWRAVFILSGATALWAIVVRKALPESKLWQPPTSQKKVDRSFLYAPRGIWLMFRAFILATCKLGTYWTCYIWLPKIFATRLHEPIAISVLWILTAQAGQLGGMLAFGRLADRIGRRMSFTLYSALTATALSALAFEWDVLILHRPYFWTVMLLLGFGSGCTAGFGVLLAELFPTEVRNFAMGTTYNLARGMQIFAPIVVLAAMTRWDIAGALSVPLILAILTGIWVWTLPETKDRNLEKIPH